MVKEILSGIKYDANPAKTEKNTFLFLNKIRKLT